MSITEPVLFGARKINLFISSWNVGNEAPENLELLLPGVSSPEANYYDLIVMGFQESTYAMTSEDNDTSGNKNGNQNNSIAQKKEKSVGGNFVKFVESAIDPCITHMHKIIMNVLGKEYEVVEHNRRAQMQLYVIAKRSLIPYISQVEKNAENTGFMHVFPNKGGLLVSLNIDGTSLAFVSCHLAAHEGVSKCQLRNDSIKEILGGVRPRDKRYDILAQCHHIFWMGDMNYRLTFSKETPTDSFQNGRKDNTPDKLIMTSKYAGLEENQMRSSRLRESEFSDRSSSASSPRNSERGQPPSSNSSSIANHAPQSPRFSKTSDLDADSDEELEREFDTEKSMKKTKHATREAEMNKIYRMIVDENWSELLKLDELNRELSAGRVLYGFTALQPNFPPTFKRIRHIAIQRCAEYDNGTDRLSKVWDIAYHDMLSSSHQRQSISGENALGVSPSDISNDTVFAQSNPRSSFPGATSDAIALGNLEVSLTDLQEITYNSITNFYHRKRLPSYTDRILYKSWDGYALNLQNIKFESVENVLSSDHKPVRASFTLQTTAGVKDVHVFYEERKQQRFRLGNGHNQFSHPDSPIANPNIRASVMSGRRGSNNSIVSSSHGSERGSLTNTKYFGAVIHNITASDESYASMESMIEALHSKVISKIRFEFYNLHGINLAEMDSSLSGGKSDPYITLSADPLVVAYDPKHEKSDSMLSTCNCLSYSTRPHEVVSPVIYHNINPVWEDPMFLAVLSYDIHGLVNNLNFVLSVWDHDRFNEDDIIGTCVISMKEMFPSLTRPRVEERKYCFDKPILNQGIVMGRMKGIIRIPDRTIEYFLQEDAACFAQAQVTEESYPTHRYRQPPARQSSITSSLPSTPRARDSM